MITKQIINLILLTYFYILIHKSDIKSIFLNPNFTVNTFSNFISLIKTIIMINPTFSFYFHDSYKIYLIYSVVILFVFLLI